MIEGEGAGEDVAASVDALLARGFTRRRSRRPCLRQRM